MDYTKILIELIKGGVPLRKIKCDYCGCTNYFFREECKGCGDSLDEEKERAGFHKDGGVSTSYPPPSPYSDWNLP